MSSYFPCQKAESSAMQARNEAALSKLVDAISKAIAGQPSPAPAVTPVSQPSKKRKKSPQSECSASPSVLPRKRRYVSSDPPTVPFQLMQELDSESDSDDDIFASTFHRQPPPPRATPDSTMQQQQHHKQQFLRMQRSLEQEKPPPQHSKQRLKPEQLHLPQGRACTQSLSAQQQTQVKRTPIQQQTQVKRTLIQQQHSLGASSSRARLLSRQSTRSTLGTKVEGNPIQEHVQSLITRARSRKHKQSIRR